VEKLAALVPPPRRHLTRFFGCLAPHAKIRSAIVPKKEEIDAQSTAAGTDAQSSNPTKKTRHIGWAELLARVFAIDMKSCPKCSGEFKVIAAIIETGAIKKILTHLDLPFRPPDIAPARLHPQMSFT
jgi:hypothetical protein